MATVRLTTPLSEEDVLKLRAGDKVLITGEVYTARDAAHKRLIEMMERGEPLPFEPKGAVIYYVGAALIAKSVKEGEIVAFEDLGTEAVRRFRVEEFPATVVNDTAGADLYEEGRAEYRV